MFLETKLLYNSKYICPSIHYPTKVHLRKHLPQKKTPLIYMFYLIRQSAGNTLTVIIIFILENLINQIDRRLIFLSKDFSYQCLSTLN